MKAVSNNRQPIIALFLFVTIIIGYLWFPYLGYRRWDGLMTASALRSWKDIPYSHIFFFAHALIIPITKVFDLFTPFQDPYFVVVFREAFFEGLNAVLLFTVLYKILKQRIPALSVSLAFAACYGNRWLVGCGEEKGVALFFANLFLILYLMHQGEIDSYNFLKTGWLKKSRDFMLGGLLGLSLAVHLGNVLLVPYIVISALSDRNGYRNPLETLRKIMRILLPAGIITIFFYAIIIIFVNEIKTPAGVLAFFTEYHTSGQFLKADYRFLNQLVRSYEGFRNFLLGPRPFGIKDFGLPALECGLSLALLYKVFICAYRKHPGLTRHLAIYLTILAIYYFSWEPWSPETWSNAAFVGFVLAAVTLRSSGINKYVWPVLLLVLLVGNYFGHQAKTERYGEILEMESLPPPHFNFLEKKLWNSTPLRQVVSEAGKMIPENAVVLLENRFAASYFQLYCRQKPIVTRYLDRSEDYLKNKMYLTNLSRYFYTPLLKSTQVRKIIKAGQSVYVFTNSSKTLRKIKKRLNLVTTKRYNIGKTGYRLYKIGVL